MEQIEADERLRREIEGERDEIVKASARFAHFLRNHSITPYNDATERYLKNLIELEEQKVRQGSADWVYF